MNAKEIGKRLGELRGASSQYVVAKAVGISKSALSMYEQGNRIPKDEIKIRIANFYNKSVQEIFYEDQCEKGNMK